jgi:ubiquinone biosynthesis monooxygenase Coq7
MQADSPASMVLFDGSCPLCTFEINQYKKISLDGKLEWVDITLPDFIPPLGTTIDILMKRLHVIKPSGEVVSGAAAFVHIWEQLPGWSRFAVIAKFPGALNVMEFGYDKFLFIRPRIQNLFRKKSCDC